MIYITPSKKRVEPSVSSSFLSKAHFLIWLNCVQCYFSVRNPDMRKANTKIFFYCRERNSLIKDIDRMLSAVWTLLTLQKKNMHKSFWEITPAQTPAFPHSYRTNAISNSSVLFMVQCDLKYPIPLFLTQRSHNCAFLLLGFNALKKKAH